MPLREVACCRWHPVGLCWRPLAEGTARSRRSCTQSRIDRRLFSEQPHARASTHLHPLPTGSLPPQAHATQMQRMQAAHMAFQSSEMRGRPSICIRRRQACSRRPELMQRMQASLAAKHSSEKRGRLSFCIRRRQARRRPSSCSACKQLSLPCIAAKCAGVIPSASAADRLAAAPSSCSACKELAWPFIAAMCAGVLAFASTAMAKAREQTHCPGKRMRANANACVRPLHPPHTPDREDRRHFLEMQHCVQDPAHPPWVP